MFDQVPIYVSEQSGDTRRIIDAQLRTRCNQLITTSANIVVGPLLKWVDAAEDEVCRSVLKSFFFFQLFS